MCLFEEKPRGDGARSTELGGNARELLALLLVREWG